MLLDRYNPAENSIDLMSNPEKLVKLAHYKMPFGKYKGFLLIDLPEPYIVWFASKGFPNGELGELLGVVQTIKVNGLEYLFEPLYGENKE